MTTLETAVVSTTSVVPQQNSNHRDDRPNGRRLVRSNATRQIIRMNEQQAAASMPVIENQRQYMANMARDSFRRVSSKRFSVLSSNTRDSLGMDDQTLQFLCEEVSSLMGGDSNHGTEIADSINYPGSLGEESHTPYHDDEDEDDNRRNSAFDVSLVNPRLQRQELERIEREQQSRIHESKLDQIREHEQDETEHHGVHSTSTSHNQENRLGEWEEGSLIPADAIEVSPGVHIPLRGSKETWTAILRGRATVTKCCACQQDLACIDDAELVICTDCWVCSPIDQRAIDGYSVEEDGAEYPHGTAHGVGLGVKADDMVKWMKSHEQE